MILPGLFPFYSEYPRASINVPPSFSKLGDQFYDTLYIVLVSKASYLYNHSIFVPFIFIVKLYYFLKNLVI